MKFLNKKGQTGGINMLMPVVSTLILAGAFAAVVLFVLAEVQSEIGAADICAGTNTTPGGNPSCGAYNSSGDTIGAVGDLVGWLPIIVVVIGGGLVISYLMFFFSGRVK